MASSYLSVIRVGPTRDNISASILKNAILDFFHTNAANEGQAKEEEQEQDLSTTITTTATTTTNNNNKMEGRFQVSNRYFKANLLLKSIQDEQGKQQDDSSCTLLQKEDGIILVFDAVRSSFDALEIVHNQAEKAQAAGDLLRLCVGVLSMEQEEQPILQAPQELRGKGAYKEEEEEYSRRILWCLDRGYEYVEADLTAQGLKQGHDCRDKEGFARIVEALAGTVWSSAVMAPKKSRQLKQDYRQEAQNQREQLHQQSPDEKEENPYVPPNPLILGKSWNKTEEQEQKSVSCAAADETDKQQPSLSLSMSDEARLEKARQALLNETNLNGQVDADADDAEQTSFNSKKMDDERRQEAFFNQFEGALQQAAAIREMSRSGQLTDDQRRQRAGEAASLLMTLMGMHGDGDSDSDGGGGGTDSDVDIVNADASKAATQSQLTP